jgi:hypothetical protein
MLSQCDTAINDKAKRQIPEFSWSTFDRSRITSVVLTVYFKPNNRDSDSEFSCELNSMHKYSRRYHISTLLHMRNTRWFCHCSSDDINYTLFTASKKRRVC